MFCILAPIPDVEYQWKSNTSVFLSVLLFACFRDSPCNSLALSSAVGQPRKQTELLAFTFFKTSSSFRDWAFCSLYRKRVHCLFHCLLLLSSRPHGRGKGVSTGGHLGCHFTVALHYSHVSFPLSPSYVVLPDEGQVILLITVNAKKFFEFGSFLRPPIWLITLTAQKCRFSIKFFHMK